MKKLFTLSMVIIIAISVFAQAPQKISYQAVIRDAGSALITSHAVGMRISILQGSATGTPVYVETQTPNTNVNGSVTIEIGGGTIVTGTFAGIDWSTGTYFIKIETDPTGGTSYTITGTSQFLSVPYASYSSYANRAAPPNLQEVINTGNSANIILTDVNKNAVSINSTGGNTSNSYYYGIVSKIAGTNGYPIAIYALSNGISLKRNYGLYSIATNAGELNTGVCGMAYGSLHDNYGVWGVANDAINGWDNRGVMGYARSTTATGWNYGVTGWAGYSDYVNIAVGAYTDSSNSATYNFGVSARASSKTATGTNYGVYSEASNGAVNYAGFFNGNVTVTGIFTQPSDERLKGDIQPISSILGKISALKPVSFYYNSIGKSFLQLPEDIQYGFVAQDMEQVFPNLVTNQVIDINSTGRGSKNSEELKNKHESNKQEFKGINYTGLISILTQGIREQQEQIKELIKKNGDLETRIRTLEDLVLLK
jgi:hypothetical protein